MENTGIYIIQNTINSKVYIGSAVSFYHRFATHKSVLLKNKHHSKPLQNFVNKYGFDALRFSPIEYCKREKLIEREQFWMDDFECHNRKKGFNISPTAGNCLGVKQSEETRAKKSANSKGKTFSDEHRKNLSIAAMGNKNGNGHIVSEEHRQTLIQVNTGKTHSEETKKKLSEKLLGHKMSKESRQKMSVSRMGHKFSPETIAKRVESRARNKALKTQKDGLQLN